MNSYERLLHRWKEISVLSSATSLLHWDEQCIMPAGGASLRGEQVALLARTAHEWVTSPEVGDWISVAEAEFSGHAADSDPIVNLREIRRSRDRAAKVPGSLVEETARTCLLSQAAWVQARKDSNFETFQPWLEKIIFLKKQEAACVQEPGQTLYDALMDEYEPGATSEWISGVFGQLRDPLIELVAAIKASPRKAPVELLERSFPKGAQMQLAREAAEAIGFNFTEGRLDESVHPFCSLIGPGDTRMTTRYDERWFGDAFFGVLHETGHGLYDQGLPVEAFGTPLGEYVSLGVHESQSRLWENFVGRSEPFWRHFFPRAQAKFDSLRDVSFDDWLFAVNHVRPSLIRTESDETTYNLHIMLRFQIEQALLTDQIAVKDLPGEWNSGMESFLGIRPTNDAEGCLQDVHWCLGSFGYFPTYTLGNLMAAQLFDKAKEEIPALQHGFASGKFTPLLDWLREKIHRHGQRYRMTDLIQRAASAPLDPNHLLNHLKENARRYYGV